MTTNRIGFVCAGAALGMLALPFVHMAAEIDSPEARTAAPPPVTRSVNVEPLNEIVSLNGRTFRVTNDAADPGVDLSGNAAQESRLAGFRVSPQDAAMGCVAPKVADDTHSQSIYNQLTATSEIYTAPKNAFATTAEARNFVSSETAQLPFFEPFRETRVQPVGGWYYDNEGFHAATDYMKLQLASGESPSFPVYAVAGGKVVSVYWSDFFGNTVVIEHTAGNGQKYRSIYMHMRNGFTHDLNAARAFVPPGNAAPDSREAKYAKYAHLANPNPLYWGTDSQTIAVQAGNTVNSGEFIGYSGNTGWGGAGWGLNTNGTPTDPAYANVHLHLYFAVRKTAAPAGWIFVDPYGVYNEVETGCYALGKSVSYPRLFAAFYPSFHNVPLWVVSTYFGYYPGMGMGLQTISVHHNNSQLLASGSFQSGLSPQWYAGFYLTAADMTTAFNNYHSQGYRPREVSAMIGPDGQPHYTAIWKKRSNESYYTWFNMTDSFFSTQWNNLVHNQGYRVEDQFAYWANGQRLHAAIFVKDGITDWKAPNGYTAADYQTFFDNVTAAGYKQTSINIEDLPGSQLVDGVFMKMAGTWPTWFGMTSSDYQSKFTQYTSQGYRLIKVQGYQNSSRFAAIWSK